MAQQSVFLSLSFVMIDEKVLQVLDPPFRQIRHLPHVRIGVVRFGDGHQTVVSSYLILAAFPYLTFARWTTIHDASGAPELTSVEHEKL
jgi:hypothetical protein